MSYSRIFRAPPHPGHLPWLAPVLTRTRSFVLTCSSRGLRPSCFDLLLPETCDAATVYVLDSDTLLPETCDASGWVRRGLHDVIARARQDPSREGRTRVPACSTRTYTNARLGYRPARRGYTQMLDSDTGLLDIQMLDSDTGLLDSDMHKCSTAYTGGVVLGSEPGRSGRIRVVASFKMRQDIGFARHGPGAWRFFFCVCVCLCLCVLCVVCCVCVSV